MRESEYNVLQAVILSRYKKHHSALESITLTERDTKFIQWNFRVGFKNHQELTEFLVYFACVFCVQEKRKDRSVVRVSSSLTSIFYVVMTPPPSVLLILLFAYQIFLF